MNKVFLIIRREYVTRVRKRSFIIMTILGPLLLAGLLLSVLFLNKVDTEKHKIVVVDDSHLFADKFKNSDRLTFLYLNDRVDSLRSRSKEAGYFGILHIPATDKVENLERGTVLYSESQPGFEIIESIKFTMEKEIKNEKMMAAGIDDKKLEMIKTDVEIQTRTLENKATDTDLVTYVGFGGGLLIYVFILIYGVMVMRGVMEEKTNRIVELMISSVKPFQLMMGKIVGVALVGLTQFLLWVILSKVAIPFVVASFTKDTGKEQIEQMMNPSGNPNYAAKIPSMAKIQQDERRQVKSKGEMLSDALETIPFTKIIISFIFFFLGGYLLYSALFAAIGAAVDSETDTQQFMLPVTLPLILSYIVSATVIGNPNGAVAFWFSMIPLTSPVVMMLRVPFDVPAWQVGLSITLLILGFLFTTWLAAKIYRTGILMYGKKVNYMELFKWLRYHN